MKKILYLFMIAALALVTSCKKESVQYEAAKKLAIVSSELEFAPGAAEGTVVVDTKSAIKATTDREWCTPTVSGNTVTVNVTQNASKLSRYALLKLAAGDASLELTIVQYGEVISGLSDLSDITAPVEGNLTEVAVKTNVNVILETESTWIHPSYSDGILKVTVDANTQPMTRFGVVSYQAGTASGSFNVTQYPELVKPATWSFTEQTPTFKYPSFEMDATVTVDAEDTYVVYSVPASDVTGDINEWIFSDLAVSARYDLLEKVEAQEGSSIKDFLMTGEKLQHFTDMALGDNYLIALGFAENGYVSGRYAYKKVTIDDIRPAYYKWAGKWKLTAKNLKGADYTETFEILVDEEDVDDTGALKEEQLIVKGFLSAGASAGEGADYNVLYMPYDALTGTILFVGQNEKLTYTHSSRGAGSCLQFVSMYIKAGQTSYTTGTGFDIFTIAMKEDGNNTTVNILERSAGLPWLAIRMRLYVTTTSKAYGLGDEYTVMLDSNFTITRAE